MWAIVGMRGWSLTCIGACFCAWHVEVVVVVVLRVGAQFHAQSVEVVVGVDVRCGGGGGGGLCHRGCWCYGGHSQLGDRMKGNSPIPPNGDNVQ